jgi:hypothetical protein
VATSPDRGARRRPAPRGLPCCEGRDGVYHLSELGGRVVGRRGGSGCREGAAAEEEVGLRGRGWN